MIYKQYVATNYESRQEVTRVDKLLSRMTCSWHIQPNPLSVIARVKYSCSLFVMQAWVSKHNNSRFTTQLYYFSMQAHLITG